MRLIQYLKEDAFDDIEIKEFKKKYMLNVNHS